jgi:hypothetical protein
MIDLGQGTLHIRNDKEDIHLLDSRLKLYEYLYKSIIVLTTNKYKKKKPK